MAPSFAAKVAPHSLVKQIRHNYYDFIPLHLTSSSSFSSPLFPSANRQSFVSYSSSQSRQVIMNMNIPPPPPPLPAAAAVMLEFGGSDCTTNTTSDGDHKYSKELEVAVRAVHLACLLCHKVQERLLSHGLPLHDLDHLHHNISPITVADWSVQATISWVLCEALGMENVSIVTEEDVEGLLINDRPSNLKNVVTTINECLSDAPLLELGLKSPNPATLDEKMVLAAISRCNSIGFGTGQLGRRFWVLDRPVDDDGKGDHKYAISLALIEDGKPVLGVLGCPNYPSDSQSDHSCAANKGSVLYARKGSGVAWMQPLLLVHGEEILFEMMAYDSVKQIEIKTSSIENPALASTISEPVLKANSTSGLGLSKVKYAAIAAGDVEIFMKYGRAGYKEKIWEHAAGVVISEEAGGVVTDAGGKPLDFSKGIYLEGLDRGIVACSGSVLHEKILDAIDASWNSSCL